MRLLQTNAAFHSHITFVYMIKIQNQNPTASFPHSWVHHVRHQVTNDFHQIDDNQGERKLQKLNCILILETTLTGAPPIPTKDTLIPNPTTTTIFVLLFIRIIFGYIFEYNLYKNVRFFENKNMKCEFNFCGIGYDCGDLFNAFNYAALSLVAAPPSPTLFDFSVLRIGLRDKPDLKYLFGVNDHGNDFGYDENKNVEIVKCEIDFSDLFYDYYPPTPFPTLASLYSTTTFSAIDNGLSEINIVKSAFGVINKYGVDYDMDSETLYGMLCFWFFTNFFLVILFEMLHLKHLNRNEHDHSLFVFLQNLSQVVMNQ